VVNISEKFGIPDGTKGDVRVICPECSPQRRKSQAKDMVVNAEKGVWHCHHCGESGGIKDKVYTRPPEVKADLPDKVIAYFAGRGIPEEILQRNKIGYEDGWIKFPYFRNGELINVKSRDNKKNFMLSKGAERILYGYDDIGETVVIVEGEIDKLSVEASGIRSCVSVPDGAPSPNTKNYSSKFSFLDCEAAKNVKEWIIAVDTDEPGIRLQEELARRLGAEKCKRVVWEGGKDANEVLTKYGNEAVWNAVRSAKPYPIEGVFTASDLTAELDHLRKHGLERGVSTGWKVLDDYYTVRPGELTVVTGFPGSGKSEFLDALMVNLVENHGWPMAIFSPENQPLNDHMARTIEKWAGVPLREMGDKVWEDGKTWLDTNYTFILPDSDADWTVTEVLAKAKALVLQKGIRGLIIDPWNEMEHGRPTTMTETEYVGMTLKHIRQFARQTKIHIWIVAHPAKPYKKDGDYAVPDPYSISGSSNWRNKADNCFTVYRKFGDGVDEGRVEIHVQKVRFRQIGRTGMCALHYHWAIGNYSEQGEIM